ncbi:MAG: ATP synthase F1 subunit delta [Nitrospira sp.]|nr:ATP synthase F1 subunit delta [Nitrospira sp.]
MRQIVAKRYAKALFQIIQPGPLPPRPTLALAEPEARLQEELERTLKTLRQTGQAFKEHDDFRHVMLNPGFDRQIKIRVLQAFLEKIQASGPAVKFLEYLIRKNRFRYLEEISRAFSVLIAEFLGIITVPISTAREPSREEQEALRQCLESATGQKVQVQWLVNPSLIGGMVIRVGEAVVDGSILGQLQAVRKKLVEA